MIAKFTRGPWKVAPLKGKYYGTTVLIGKGEVRVWQPLGNNYEASVRELADGWTPDCGFDHVETQESYATAVLIAAAPALLEACRQVIAEIDDCCNEPSTDWDFYNKLQKAIAMAEGRE